MGYNLGCPSKCKHAVQEKDHIYCRRDGSVRKRGCPCNHYALSWWEKLKRKLGF